MSWSVPLTDVAMPEEDVQAVLDCLKSGWLTLGPRTKAFEEAFAAYAGTDAAIAVSSGTAALHLACQALGLGPDDELIVPGLAFVASANAARYVGATPVLCDVLDPRVPALDLSAVEASLTERTRAIMAVHFCGYPDDVLALRALCDDRGLFLIENAAQAIGAHVDAAGRKVGTVGDVGCFSLSSTAQLCVAEGGMVVARDEAVNARIRSLRSHAMTSGTWDRHRGHESSYDIVDVGYNFRMDEPRAALGLSRLTRLDEDLASRRASVRAYREALAGVDGIELMWDEQAVGRSTHAAFGVLVDGGVEARDAVRETLRAQGVQTTVYPALSRLSDLSRFTGPDGLPNAEACADGHCMLPLSSQLAQSDLERVVAALRTAVSVTPAT